MVISVLGTLRMWSLLDATPKKCWHCQEIKDRWVPVRCGVGSVRSSMTTRKQLFLRINSDPQIRPLPAAKRALLQSDDEWIAGRLYARVNGHYIAADQPGGLGTRNLFLCYVYISLLDNPSNPSYGPARFQLGSTT